MVEVVLLGFSSSMDDIRSCNILLGDKNDNVEVPGVGEIPLKLFLKDYLGFEYDFLGVVAVAHVAWAVLFSFVFAYGIKFLNFQRR
uniref:Putative ovule protein n=1 Tax=Solanum chacoense TaxID=4108 RepID=A0A0V0GP73_SOLCH